MSTEKITLTQLESFLFQSADILRGKKGSDEFKDENRELIRQVDDQLSGLDATNKADKKKINALKKDKTALEARIAQTDALLDEIGGRLSKRRR